jgi:hypothetical protein
MKAAEEILFLENMHEHKLDPKSSRSERGRGFPEPSHFTPFRAGVPGIVRLVVRSSIMR